MIAEIVMDELMELRRTIGRLHDPYIISVDINESRPPKIHLHLECDPDAVIRDIGLGLLDRDTEWDPEWERWSITDINGVEVFWLKKKAAPDVAASKAAGNGEEANGEQPIMPSTHIIDDVEEAVKEAGSFETL